MEWPPPVEAWRELGRAMRLVVPVRRLGFITDERQVAVATCAAQARDLFVADDVGMLFELRHVRTKWWQDPQSELRTADGALIGREQSLMGLAWTDTSGATVVAGKSGLSSGNFQFLANGGGAQVVRARFQRNTDNVFRWLRPDSVVLEFGQNAPPVLRAFAIATAWKRWVCRYDE